MKHQQNVMQGRLQRAQFEQVKYAEAINCSQSGASDLQELVTIDISGLK